jgi:hypothetical protein
MSMTFVSTPSEYEYRIQFSHGMDERKRHHVTTCRLQVKANGHWGDTAFVGVAKTHEKDRFVKETGRRVSLVRAIKHLNRETRTRAWAAYWQRGVRTAQVGSQMGVVLT